MSDRDDRDLRFDEELRRAARAMVTDELPRGILEPSLGEARARRPLPGFVPGAAAIVVLVVATAVALNPGFGGPRPSPTPAALPTATRLPSPTATVAPIAAFRSTTAIRNDLLTLAYVCQAGQPLASIGPGPDAGVRESAVCVAPASIGPFMAAVIVEESTSATVVEVHAKADIVGADTAAARAAVASALAKAAAISSGIPSAGNALGDWVNTRLPTVEPSGGQNAILRGFDVKIARQANGSYLLIIHLAAAP